MKLVMFRLTLLSLTTEISRDIVKLEGVGNFNDKETESRRFDSIHARHKQGKLSRMGRRFEQHVQVYKERHLMTANATL